MTAAALVVPVALAALAVGACGGSDEPSQAVATNAIAMAKSYRFDPERVVVDAGSTVTWRNDDNFSHTVRVDGADGETHKLAPGDEVSIRFARVGTYAYVCTLHPDMEGEVTVR